MSLGVRDQKNAWGFAMSRYDGGEAGEGNPQHLHYLVDAVYVVV